ncbi:hypothetical protein sos41_05970 [Alphaproteobacteria bacterium SO-S41]|nr:hypothetical protein sos41_05970 [Alphaproteobacteria bacterium SO-S41]
MSARPASNWWKPWTREFWAIDVVLGVLGLVISVVATLLVFYLSAGYEGAIRAKADEAHDLNAALTDNGRALFDVATTFAMERGLEAHADAVAQPEARRAMVGAALGFGARTFTAYLAATAPDEIPGFEAEAARLIAAYAKGDDAVPAKLRALTSGLMDGPAAAGNAAKGARRPQVVIELAELRRARDFWRAVGGFLQVFGIILVVSGQVAGRKGRTWQHAPPEIQALPSHPFTRRFWTVDVVGIAIGTLVTLTGTAVLFFTVDAHQRDIDEARRQLDGRETLIALSDAAFNEYDDIALLEPFVADIEARRTPASHVPPGIRAAWGAREDVTAIEIAPAPYVAVRKSYPVYWLVRMLGDNVEANYAAPVETFYALVQEPASPAYRAFEADILTRAHARMDQLKADRDALSGALGVSERAQSTARDRGSLLLLLGLVLTFAGNVTYYKRPRR